MRDRGDIEDDASQTSERGYAENDIRALTLEVLLDIRELLKQTPVDWWAQTSGPRLGPFATQHEAWKATFVGEATGPRPLATVWCTEKKR